MTHPPSITTEHSTSPSSDFLFVHTDVRLTAATARRNAARWAVARTLPATPDGLWCELNEAEYEYREALKARTEKIRLS